MHGTDDRIRGRRIGERLAELTGGELVLVEGAGHGPPARDPVLVNHQIRRFVERFDPPPVEAAGARAGARGRAPAAARALPLLADRARARAARRRDRRRAARAAPRPRRSTGSRSTRSPGCSQQRGERLHPASAHLANESGHIEDECGEHDLHAFQAIRRMDEILVNNFMVFDELVEEEPYDLVIGDEAWDVDYFLHENPELKRFAYAWITDFVGWLPMPDGGAEEAALTADYNAEMIEQRARFRRLRDRSVFVGNPDDVVADAFGPGLPAIRDWTEQNFDFAGYVTGFDPASLGDPAELRARLGYRPDETVCVVTVGGSGVGAPLLRRVLDAVPAGPARGAGPAVRDRRRAADRPAVAAARATAPACSATCRT